VDAKSHEIPAVRELLKAFTDLAGAVITAGALHTRSGTAQAITGRHAGYVMTVRARTPGSAAVVEGHLVAVRVRERESAAERPVGGR
jgi:hypothetical protein